MPAQGLRGKILEKKKKEAESLAAERARGRDRKKRKRRIKMERSEREFILLRGKISVTLLAYTRDVIT